MIGNYWHEARFESGPRKGELRLADPEDYVRVEIEPALNRKLRVIPVLVGSRSMPTEAELPESLRQLASKNAFELRSGREFNDRVTKLIAEIGTVIPANRVTNKISKWLGSYLK